MTISLSTTTLTPGSILGIPFQQASIYADACFILSLIDPGDPHHNTCKDLLLMWAHAGATLCYSNHVQHEVTHALLKLHVLSALDHFESLGCPTTAASLTQNDLHILVDLPTVITMYNNALVYTTGRGRPIRTGLPRDSRGYVKVIVPSFVKYLKRNGIGIKPFYETVNDIFDRLISRLTISIHHWYNLNLSCLTSTEQIGLNALVLAKESQLDSTDAIHLCTAFQSNCDYFVTKDSDLSGINVGALQQHHKLYSAATGTFGGSIQQPSPVSGTLLYIP